jgi:hypothetical protein
MNSFAADFSLQDSGELSLQIAGLRKKGKKIRRCYSFMDLFCDEKDDVE